MESNNTKAMREALDDIGNACAWIADNCNDGQTAKYMWDIVEKVKSALAKPPRNCEVGTAEEQADRYEVFCAKYFAKDRDDDICGSCPLSNQSNLCKFAWAQMPYEDGGVG